MAPSPRMGLAIVGCGQIVTHHLEAITATRAYEVRALCDPSVERRQVINHVLSGNQEGTVAQFDTLDALVEQDAVLATIDVIFIAVPHDLHEALAMRAVATGKVVVLEKPLAPTLAACERLERLSKETGRLIVAEQSPYWEEVVLAKDLIQRQNAIGTVVSAAAYYYESMRDNVTSGSVDAAGGLGWRGSLARAGGGIALDGGLHWIRPLAEMCGPITKVVGVVRRDLAPQLKMEGESLGHALLEIAPKPLSQPDGAGPLIATYSCNMLATAPMAHDTCPYFRVTGDKGEIVIHGDGLFKDKPGAGGLRLYNEKHPVGQELFPPDRKGGFFLGFRGLRNRIHDICIKGDAVAAHETVIKAANDVRVVLALYKSSNTGMWELIHEGSG